MVDSFARLAQVITDNGGKICDLDDPKLTHVLVDKRDESRRLELIKRTAQPKRRHLVISEYINACLEEDTLLNEEGECARFMSDCRPNGAPIEFVP